MCRNYSAETEAALRELAKFELVPISPDGARAFAENDVLWTLVNDPYQPIPVRRAIQHYLSRTGAEFAAEFAAHKALVEKIKAIQDRPSTPETPAENP
jgi:hypothetical protein